MEEHEAARRIQSIQEKHFRQWVWVGALLAACVILILTLSVWLVRPFIQQDKLYLVPFVAMWMFYFVFTVYSVVVCLGTEIDKAKTTRSGKLLWWHGAGWIIAMCLAAVSGLIFYVHAGLFPAG